MINNSKSKFPSEANIVIVGVRGIVGKGSIFDTNNERVCA
jgi:hypothetical protein